MPGDVSLALHANRLGFNSKEISSTRERTLPDSRYRTAPGGAGIQVQLGVNRGGISRSRAWLEP